MPGEDHVVMVAVGVEGGAEIPDRGGVQLAVFVGQPHHLVAGELDGPGLVAVDMAGGCCHNALPTGAASTQ